MQDSLWIEVMSKFEINIRGNADEPWDSPQGILLRAGDSCFTKLLRERANTEDSWLQAPPIQLAFWLTDNWWRLRWEPMVSEEVDPDWRLAHELSAIGGGYIWPQLRIWGEDNRVGLSCRSDPQETNVALRFTTDSVDFVPAEQFEGSVDEFLQRAIDAKSNDREALRAQVSALVEERNDRDAATWRRIEAKLGYDVDSAPDGLVERLMGYVGSYGHDGVEEAIVAVQGSASADALDEEIEFARKSGVACSLEDATAAVGDVDRGRNGPIWRFAERAASAVRRSLGAQEGPLRNTCLAELLNTSRVHFRARESGTTQHHYGLRLRKGDGNEHAVALSARWPQGRRFELCRTLGDAIWSGNDALGPMTKAKTGRQKFQRAFAQALLCPFDDLSAYIKTKVPSEDDISAAARHFHVSEAVVKTVLVIKGVIGRQRLDDLVEAA